MIPIIIYPSTNFYTYNAVKTLTMHSVIYSETIINNYDKLNLEYKHWDVIIDKNVKNKYLYYMPLCYQTFPETESVGWYLLSKSFKRIWAKATTGALVLPSDINFT